MDGATAGPGNTITTGTYGANNDVINKEAGQSTRTGYYLRKLLRQDVNPDPSINNAQYHYTARIRYTEDLDPCRSSQTCGLTDQTEQWFAFTAPTMW